MNLITRPVMPTFSQIGEIILSEVDMKHTQYFPYRYPNKIRKKRPIQVQLRFTKALGLLHITYESLNWLPNECGDAKKASCFDVGFRY